MRQLDEYSSKMDCGQSRRCIRDSDGNHSPDLTYLSNKGLVLTCCQARHLFPQVTAATLSDSEVISHMYLEQEEFEEAESPNSGSPPPGF